MHTTQANEQPQAIPQGNSPWRTVRWIFVVLSLLGLVTLNVATLTNDEVHASAYNGLKWVLGAIAATMAAADLFDSVLRHSPSNVRKGEVEKKTAALRTENTKLKQTNADLDTTNKDLQTKHAKLSLDHDDLDKRVKKLDVDHKDLTQRHATLEKNNLELSKQHQALTASERKTRQATQKLSTNVAKRSKNAATRNIAGAAGESVPIIGIPIVAGLLAWDIYDLCQNLKDLNEMNIALGNAQVDEKSVCGVHVPTADELRAKVTKDWKTAYAEALKALERPIAIPTISWDQLKAPVCTLVSVPGIC